MLKRHNFLPELIFDVKYIVLKISLAKFPGCRGYFKLFQPIEDSLSINSCNFYQCFGSGSGRIIGPDPYSLQETLIRVPKKIVINSHTNQPKL